MVVLMMYVSIRIVRAFAQRVMNVHEPAMPTCAPCPPRLLQTAGNINLFAELSG